MSCKPPQQKIQTSNREMLSWTSWDFSGLESNSVHSTLGMGPMENSPWWHRWVMMWKAEQCAGKDRREICSVAYGKFKIRQVINDNIPPFFTEAFRGTCDGKRRAEEHIIYQVGFFRVASIMCVYQMSAYALHEWKLPAMLLFNTHHVYFFTDWKIAVTN